MGPLTMDQDKHKLVDEVAKEFENACKEGLSNRLESFYIVGSYAFDKISLDRPDINFLIVLKGYPVPDDHLKIGKICRDLANTFKKKCVVRIEFRPFRYIYPKSKSDYEVFLNPIVVSTKEVQAMGCIFTKWFTEGLKDANKLLYGTDFLKTLKIGAITREDIFKGAMFDLPFFTIPLTRAPAQYDESESSLLFNEALTNAKNLAYLGLEIAMNETELKSKKYVEYIKSKGDMVNFYDERYGGRAAELVGKIFDARTNYLKYKDEPLKAKEMFAIALEIGDIIRAKLFQK